MFHAFIMKARTQMLKFPKVGIRIFIFVPREGFVPNHGYKARTEFIARSCDRLRRLRWLYELALWCGELMNRSGVHVVGGG